MMIGKLGWEKIGLTGLENIWPLCCTGIKLRVAIETLTYHTSFLYHCSARSCSSSSILYKCLCILLYKKLNEFYLVFHYRVKDAWLRLGMLLTKRGNPEKAVSWYDRSLVMTVSAPSPLNISPL